MAMNSLRMPDAAFAWLLGEDGASASPHTSRVSPPTTRQKTVLNLGASTSGVGRLLATKHRVIAVDPDPDTITKLGKRHHDAIAKGMLVATVGAADALPLKPFCAQVVMVNQAFHRRIPGKRIDSLRAVQQLAGALTPEGWVAGSSMVRDDSVPWVKRLIALMRSVDETAMSGEIDDPERDAILSSHYFPNQDERDFRLWVPISRAELVGMVAAVPTVRHLAPPDQNGILKAAGQIFDSAASSGELLLPYLLKCWRAQVSHGELTTPVVLHDDVLQIRL